MDLQDSQGDHIWLVLCCFFFRSGRCLWSLVGVWWAQSTGVFVWCGEGPPSHCVPGERRWPQQGVGFPGAKMLWSEAFSGDIGEGAAPHTGSAAGSEVDAELLRLEGNLVLLTLIWTSCGLQSCSPRRAQFLKRQAVNASRVLGGSA